MTSSARPLAAVLVAAVAVVAVPSTAAAASKAKAKPATVRVVKPRPVRYVVVGTLASSTTSTITLAPTTGGNAKVRPAPVTLTVPGTAVVSRDGAAATLADLVAGDHVAASGTRTGTAVSITKVIATSPEPTE